MIGFNALVTGANGFVGAHLCKLLLEKQVTVYAMVRKTSNLSLMKILNPQFEKIHLVYGDLTDYQSLAEHVQGKDVIFNIGGVLKGLYQEEYDRVNVDGYVNLCKALVEKNPGIKRVIMTSSIAAAGPGQDEKIVCEDVPAKPLEGDRYGISKYRMECAIKPYFDKLPLVIIRPPPVFGPGDEPSLDLFKSVKNGIKAVIGKEKRAFSVVSVDDLCAGYYACAENPNAVHQIFYFCSGDPVDWGELQDIMAKEVFQRKKKLHTLALSKGTMLKLAGMLEFIGRIRHKVPFLNKPKIIEGAEINYSYSCEKAKRLLGWRPQDTVVTTLKKAGDWYRDHGWI